MTLWIPAFARKDGEGFYNFLTSRQGRLNLDQRCTAGYECRGLFRPIRDVPRSTVHNEKCGRSCGRTYGTKKNGANRNPALKRWARFNHAYGMKHQGKQTCGFRLAHGKTARVFIAAAKPLLHQSGRLRSWCGFQLTVKVYIAAATLRLCSGRAPLLHQSSRWRSRRGFRLAHGTTQMGKGPLINHRIRRRSRRHHRRRRARPDHRPPDRRYHRRPRRRPPDRRRHRPPRHRRRCRRPAARPE